MSCNKLAFYAEVGKLKSLPRRGWVIRGIPNPETVASHMYRSQFIARDFAIELGEDPMACMYMMMIHDLPEARAGDITPHCNVSKKDKLALEEKAARELAVLSGDPDFLPTFKEYNEKETLRAQICGDADKIECLIQTMEYAHLYPSKIPTLKDFWANLQGRMYTEPGNRIFQQLHAQWKALPKPHEFKIA